MENDIHTHVVLVVAFVQKGNKFLLAKRSSTDPQAGGQWSIPGGKVDLEVGTGIIEETLRREVKEEVGLEISDQVTYLGSDSFVRVSGHHVVALTFLCRWKSGIAKPLEDQEKVRWFTLQELKTTSFPNYLKPRLEALFYCLDSTKN